MHGYNLYSQDLLYIVNRQKELGKTGYQMMEGSRHVADRESVFTACD